MLKFRTIYVCHFRMVNGYTSIPLAIFENEEDALDYTKRWNAKTEEGIHYYYYDTFLYGNKWWEPTDEEIDKSVKEMYNGAFGE